MLKYRFSIDAKKTHGYLLDCCLDVMSRYLRQDICKFERPGTRARDVSRSQVDQEIPLPLQYACRFGFITYNEAMFVRVNILESQSFSGHSFSFGLRFSRGLVT